MKSIRTKSFPACNLFVMLFLAVLLGASAFSAPLQTQEDAVSSEAGEPPVLTPDQIRSGVEELESQKQSEEPESGEESEMEAPLGYPIGYPGSNARERVRVGGSQQVGPNDMVRNMVTVFGTAEMAGKTYGEMVTVFGNSKVTGEVGREMATVFGNAEMSGKVTREMVTVFGDAEVNGEVGRELTVVFGSLKLGPNAVVNRDCVVVFGKIDKDPGAFVGGNILEIMPWLSGLKSYIRDGLLLGRLLPPGSVLAWIIVALHFVLYFLVAVIVPKPVASSVRQLDDNPFLCFGIGLLTMILMVPLSLILIATGIGIILLPLVGLAEIALKILGKVSTLEFFGLQILRRFRSDADNRPIVAFLIGFLLVTVIYMIPILGLLTWILLRPLSLGAAMLAVFKSVRKNGNGTPAPGIPLRSSPDQTASSATTPVSPDVPPAPPSSYVEGETQNDSRLSSPSEPATGFSGATGPETVIMPRAGFWIRIGANILDAILLLWLIAFDFWFFLFIWLAYHVGMWTWKGTTIGGIICKIKLVRLDGNPADFGVSLVRFLASFFSAAALGLGFFWTGWTRNRQSWHDLIAGTVIVRVPQSIKLI